MNMKQLVAAVMIAVAAPVLAGCDEQAQLVRTELMALVPPEELYNCPVVRQLPASNTLTDVQVARLIAELWRNNQTCARSIAAIRDWVSRAQTQVGGQNNRVLRSAQQAIARQDGRR